MSKTKVYFIDLAVANKYHFVCDLTEKIYNEGFSLTIFALAQNEVVQLDRMLWNWKQDSFIPHCIENNDGNSLDERVVITTNPEIIFKHDVLLLNNPLPQEKLLSYKYVLDFAEVYDNQKRQESRLRYKTLRDSENFEMEYIKLGAFLNLKLISD